MNFYQVTHPETGVAQLARTQDEARQINRHFEKVDVPTDARGLCAYINELLAGGQTREAAPAPAPAPASVPAPVPAAPPAVPYAVQSASFEDAFENMPLAMQLHFAALAMEAARSKIAN